jgi:hypothetical protein
LRNERAKPRVVYVSYDGASEPLGQSQVVAYLERLARSCDIALISFEKDDSSRRETAESLATAGIAWVPLRYHRRPPVISTLWDVVVGVRALRRACRATNPAIVHVRSYVAALIAVTSAPARKRPWKLLFDIRGFWPDERVAGGSWSESGWLYALAKRCERRFFAESDAVVTLAAASKPQIRSWLGPRPAPIVVIPTCAEVERFSDNEPRQEGPRAVWCGSVGTFYRFDLAVGFAEALQMQMTVLTRQVQTARSQLGERAGDDVREVPHADVPRELFPGDIGMCFYAGNFANLARAPTRFAEYLAAGLIVAITPGVGDLDAIVLENELGVRIEDETSEGLARAARRARELAADPERIDRARRIAAELYSVDRGASEYLALYRRLVGDAASPGEMLAVEATGVSINRTRGTGVVPEE